MLLEPILSGHSGNTYPVPDMWALTACSRCKQGTCIIIVFGDLVRKQPTLHFSVQQNHQKCQTVFREPVHS